jgi:hypothetical protein
MTCQHHWLLEAPQHLTGDTEGVCKLCGEQRTFQPDKEWRAFLDRRSSQGKSNRKHAKAVAS